MSGFTDSFHLRTFDQTKVMNLLSDAEMPGYVFGENNGWVTFVVEYRGGNVDEIISEFNPGILLYYVYLEDHMWEIKIYNKDEIVFDYAADWAGDTLVIEKRLFDLDLINELVVQQGNSTEHIEEIFDFRDNKIDYSNPPAYLIAQKLGLTHYESISLEFLSNFNDIQLKEMNLITVKN